MTDAAASMKTDMSIATDKNTTITGVTTDTSVSSMKPIVPDDDASQDDPLALDVEGIFPPLKIHASRPTQRLSTERLSGSNFDIPPQLVEKARRRKSGGGGASGTRSPMFDGGSSISSLEDAGFDTDILTDKMGHLDLDVSISKLNHSSTNLHTVAERLSDETLEDSHAFTDIKSRGTVSRGGSIATGGDVASNVLEPLDEIDEELEGTVKITNLGEILEVAEEDTPNES